MAPSGAICISGERQGNTTNARPLVTPRETQVRDLEFVFGPLPSGSRQEEELAGFVTGELDRRIFRHLLQPGIRALQRHARRNLAV